MSNAAEKISDFFNVSLSELETNIVANAVKFNTQPSRLLDELQQSITEFKTKFYESLHQLLQFIGQINNGKDILKIAQQVEQQVVKIKQQQLLVQMKLVLNSKLKALLDTFGGENQQKTEVQIQVKQLKDSLFKIESTLMEQQQIMTPAQQYITPYPKKNFITASSQDALTPNLSDEAEMRGRGFYITPENRQQQPRQFDHSHQQFSSNDSVSIIQNKTLNSFDKEKSEDKLDLQSPFFGLQQQQQQPKLFQNELMDQYLQRIDSCPQESQLIDQPIREQSLIQDIKLNKNKQESQEETKVKINNQQATLTSWENHQIQHTFQHLDSLQTTRTEQYEIQQNISTPSQHQTRNQSVEPNASSQSPNAKQRLIKTSKSKEPFSRCRSSLETTNLIHKLNQVEAQSQLQSNIKTQQSKFIKSKGNKENQSQPIVPTVKCSKPTKPQITVCQKQKTQSLHKIQPVKKQKSN